MVLVGLLPFGDFFVDLMGESDLPLVSSLRLPLPLPLPFKLPPPPPLMWPLLLPLLLLLPPLAVCLGPAPPFLCMNVGSANDGRRTCGKRDEQSDTTRVVAWREESARKEEFRPKR